MSVKQQEQAKMPVFKLFNWKETPEYTKVYLDDRYHCYGDEWRNLTACDMRLVEIGDQKAVAFKDDAIQGHITCPACIKAVYREEIGITPEQIEELKAGTAKDPLPCPNPVCQNPHPKLSTKRWPNNTKDYFVVCDVCKMRGARVKADRNAIRLWNMLHRVGQPESIFAKTPKQLFREFEALTNDTQRWQWILTNQGGEFALHLDNDAPCVTFVGIEEYLEFDECIRWSAGAVTLLDAMDIKREML